MNQPIKIFHLKTLTYGEGPSGYIATRVLHQSAYDHQSEYSLGAEVLRKEIYMDDVLSGAPTIAKIKTKLQQTIQLGNVGGFKLRKYLASSQKILNDLPGMLSLVIV